MLLNLAREGNFHFVEVNKVTTPGKKATFEIGCIGIEGN